MEADGLIKNHAGHLILCVNSGSSSIKFSLYQLSGREEHLVVDGIADRIGLKTGHLRVFGSGKNNMIEVHGDFPDHKTAVRTMFAALGKLAIPSPAAVGHRLVHGGTHHTTPTRIDPDILRDLDKLIPFAPLHLPSEILCIKEISDHFPGLPQAACFDTAFHHRMPELAQRFPLPRDLWDEGVRRYGFHGLSYEYILQSLGPDAHGRLIIAHLGNGASMVAVKGGIPLDTTMGFSPTGGFMMSTRSGDLDPGVLLFLMNEKGYSSSKIEDLVNHRSGLLGVSALSPDMKTLLEEKKKDQNAAQAVEMFCYHLRKNIGALAAVLGGVDNLIFTGGIGEKAAEVRRRVCSDLGHLGIIIDARRNESGEGVISAPKSPCTVRIIPTNEDLVIARHTYKMFFRL